MCVVVDDILHPSLLGNQAFIVLGEGEDRPSRNDGSLTNQWAVDKYAEFSSATFFLFWFWFQKWHILLLSVYL